MTMNRITALARLSQNSSSFFSKQKSYFPTSISIKPNLFTIKEPVKNFSSFRGSVWQHPFKYAGTLEEFDDFCKESKPYDAIEVAKILKNKGIYVDKERYFLLMQKCADDRALESLKHVHGYLTQTAFEEETETRVYNKIIEMYMKCDSLSDAYKILENIPEHDLGTWVVMINGLAKLGFSEEAIDMFSQFEESGLTPNREIFNGVIFACGVVGDIEKGMSIFESMGRVYSLEPSMENYVSVVTMLGCRGHLDDAMEFVQNLPVEPNVEIWESLMTLCRLNGDIELGDQYAEIVNFLDASRLMDKQKKGLVPVHGSERWKKLSIKSRMEATSFKADDKSHAETEEIYAIIRRLNEQIREIGYVPCTRHVTHDIEIESQEEFLLGASENLCLAHGLMTSYSRAPINIFRNFRLSRNSHTALKFMSTIVGRKFIVREKRLFHFMKGGFCSCRDWW